ncbi:hypothetical protein CJ030_MR7G011823 [Morella rubra]|uniref:Uncharacterized protein n=1 Tax=Morella rubra TaxID=262757 RepID=A0A6A1V517_9ROSI|nr:hypothetical protein CJ030_MR7G011823 [Morella rubra]
MNEAYQKDDAIDLFIDFRQFNLNLLRRDDVTPNVIQASDAIDRGRKDDHFDLDYTRQEDVRTVVETMMTARRKHCNRMHAYFKKFPSKEAALLKPHPNIEEEQWKELCNLFRVKHLCKQNKKNRSKLTMNHAAGLRSFQRTQVSMKNQESGEINPVKLYKKNYTNKDGVWTSEGARKIYFIYFNVFASEARDEIEAMRAAREKDLQEFVKKQAKMEATLRDHREEHRVEQEHARLEQEEHMKREQEHKSVEYEERMQKEQERLRAEISKSWRRKCPL